MSHSVRNVSVAVKDLLRASNVLRALVIRRTTTDDRALIETDRYQRRELIRNGISFQEVNGGRHVKDKS